jgi:hypothetical protein
VAQGVALSTNPSTANKLILKKNFSDEEKYNETFKCRESRLKPLG